LEKIDERKAEMKLGRNRRDYGTASSRQQPLQPVRLPAITETIFPPQPENRPLDHLGKPGGVTLEHVNQLLKSQAEIIQKQLQALQDKIDTKRMTESNAPQLNTVEKMQNRAEDVIAVFWMRALGLDHLMRIYLELPIRFLNRSKKLKYSRLIKTFSKLFTISVSLVLMVLMILWILMLHMVRRLYLMKKVIYIHFGV